MNHPKPIPLWIVAGFLGSGKTTVLNNLIRSFAPDPVAVLVNDFGKIGVDASLIETRRDDAGASDDGAITVIDLNGGQIFCSCISGAFVDRLVDLAAMPVSAILVESSGMAKPGAMGPILQEARKRSGERFFYAGMVTVADAPRLEKLLTVVNAVEEQIVYADLVVLNKCDLTDSADRRAATKRIGGINPRAAVHEVEYGAIDRRSLPKHPISEQTRSGPAGEDYLGWGNKKPLCRSWVPDHPVSRHELEAELDRLIGGGALRIKGYLATTEGTVYVDAVGDRCELRPVEAATEAFAVQTAHEEGLTIFEPAGSGKHSPLFETVYEGESCD